MNGWRHPARFNAIHIGCTTVAACQGVVLSREEYRNEAFRN